MGRQIFRDRLNPKRSSYPFISLLRLAWSVDTLATLRAFYWLAIGKRLRGRIALTGIAAQSRDAYGTWIRIAEQKTIDSFLTQYPPPSEISVLVAVANAEPGSDRTNRTIASIGRAFGTSARIELLADRHVDPSLLVEAAGNETRWLLSLLSGDIVSPYLGAAVERATSHAPHASIVHWNADYLSDDRRHDPFIKPVSWDPVLHAQADCLSSMSLVRIGAAFECFGRLDPMSSADVYLLASRVAETHRQEDFVHVPLILTHRVHSRRPAQAATLEFMGFPTPKHWPSVTIIIPTRDRLELLSDCLTSLKKTDYAGDWKILVVDNDSEERATKDYLNSMVERGAISVISVPGSFNFSRLNNRAVEQSDAEFVCLLNNDVTVLDSDWLSKLVSIGEGENVGAVGPMLLYPDGTIQHAGVVIGIGNAAGHIQRGVRPDTEIHPSWTSATRQVSAVTAACLLVRRADYLAVGGLNERNLPVAFNDVDLCLKLQEAGRRNIYLASTSMTHHESKSRGSDLEAVNFDRFCCELAYLQQRWGTEIHQDPWFSPLFSRSSERCALQL